VRAKSFRNLPYARALILSFLRAFVPSFPVSSIFQRATTPGAEAVFGEGVDVTVPDGDAEGVDSIWRG